MEWVAELGRIQFFHSLDGRLGGLEDEDGGEEPPPVLFCFWKVNSG